MRAIQTLAIGLLLGMLLAVAMLGFQRITADARHLAQGYVEHHLQAQACASVGQSAAADRHQRQAESYRRDLLLLYPEEEVLSALIQAVAGTPKLRCVATDRGLALGRAVEFE